LVIPSGDVQFLAHFPGSFIGYGSPTWLHPGAGLVGNTVSAGHCFGEHTFPEYDVPSAVIHVISATHAGEVG
jgi:hypothetical protein